MEDQRHGRYARKRKELGITAVFNRVDTCAAEFESFTPYLYSSYESENEAAPSNRKKVMILGSGPNRIGQGIEFDYCCCHASFALQEFGYESIMVNCNPETVSTDYDTSDRLYFEPLTLEEVLNIFDVEKPDGVIVQFGGQTPLNLALPLKAAGVPIIGTDPADIDLAEDRKQFGKLLDDLQNSIARERRRHQRRRSLRRRAPHRFSSAGSSELRAGRPRHGDRLRRRNGPPLHARGRGLLARPASADRPLPGIGHRSGCRRARRPERRGPDRRHHGAHRRSRRAFRRQLLRSSAAGPLGTACCESSRTTPTKLARALHVIGLMNVQYAIKDGTVYVLEVNPRASRTVPYVSKATGVPLPKIAVGLMLGKSLADFADLTGGQTSGVLPVSQFFVKSPVFPFEKFPGVDPALGPEMRSTGEVMGVGENFGEAFGKGAVERGHSVARERRGLHQRQRSRQSQPRWKWLANSPSSVFRSAATRGTAAALRAAGLTVKTVFKVNEGRPNAVDLLKAGSLKLVIYTTTGGHSFSDEQAIRRAAVAYRVPCITTISGAKASAEAIASRRRDPDPRLEPAGDSRPYRQRREVAPTAG